MPTPYAGRGWRCPFWEKRYLTAINHSKVLGVGRAILVTKEHSNPTPSKEKKRKIRPPSGKEIKIKEDVRLILSIH